MDKEQEAIKRMKLAAKMSERYYGKPLLITNSGGKDSLVCLEIAKRAGIEYEVIHSHTTADAPETVRYVRKQHKALEEQGVKCSIHYPTYKGQPVSLWSLIPIKLMPPTRLARYCCDILKEDSGNGSAIVTGVRTAESKARSTRKFAAACGSKNVREEIDFTRASELYDNDGREGVAIHDSKFINSCHVKGKTAFRPIIDWTDGDVWDYIDSEKLEVNPIYRDYGLLRCGCVGCPMAGKGRNREFAIWPKYKDMWLNAFDRMLKARKAQGKNDTTGKWKDARAVFDWWMQDDTIPGQMSLFDGGSDETP